MKKFTLIIIAAFCISLLAGCRSNHTLVLSDVQISVKDSLWTVEPAYDSLGNSIHAFVSLGSASSVMSAVNGLMEKGIVTKDRGEYFVYDYFLKFWLNKMYV